MTSFLDIAPFPWHDPLARALHKSLYQNVPRPSRALVIASSVAIDTGLVNPDQAPYDLWSDILQLAANSGKTRSLIQKLREDPNVSAAHSLFDALLKDQRPVTDREPQTYDGAPKFIEKNDEISEPEALLFHDDLTLSTGRLRWLAQILQRLEALATGVCRLEVARGLDSQSGTGLRVGSKLLLTNWHVLHFDGQTVTGVTAEFGYELDDRGKPLTAASFNCQPESIAGSQADDWAVILTEEVLPDNIPVLDIYSGASPEVDAPAFIIQHPGGGRKRVAYARNRITYFDERVVQYLSDTQVGSSGSPVFDETGRIIALHHAGGRPQQVAGQLPAKKNEGIRIARIAEGVKGLGIS